MLIQFSVKNFKTFKDKATLSLVASNSDKETRKEENVIAFGKMSILKSAVIYGANASGKTALIKAFDFMRLFAHLSSYESQKGNLIPVSPFLLNDESETEPSEFEIIFTHKDVYYRYGFEATKDKIVAEWLYYKPKTKEIELFYRDFQDFTTHPKDFVKGRLVVKEGLVVENALLLTVAANFNDEKAGLALEGINKLVPLSSINSLQDSRLAIYRSQDPTRKEQILELLKVADLGIADFEIDNRDKNGHPRILFPDKIDVKTSHKKYDADKNLIAKINFELDSDESAGTRQFFALSGPILYCLENGGTLIVDELDSNLHPNLVFKIVSLFNSKDLNPNNAQLIFNTHDTNLLTSKLFRRDQIWFTEKNKFGEASLYSLADFKSTDVRNNEAYESNYINGKYGAIPYLGDFDNLAL